MVNVDAIVTELILSLSGVRFSLSNEKALQDEIEKVFKMLPLTLVREHRFDKKSRVDFFVSNCIAVEVKIKGSAKSIYKQCERYCSFPEVKELILITNRAMGFPLEINGKPCYVMNLGSAWL